MELGSKAARVRVCKGGYGGSGAQSFASKDDIDRAFVRRARHLLESDARPMFATHDGRLIQIVNYLATVYCRGRAEWEVQTLQGVRPDLVENCRQRGVQVRCYLAFGHNWYSWLVRRFSEKPSNVLLLARAVVAG